MKAVIFDCDGTLVDSEVLSNEVLVEAVAEHGLLLSVDEADTAFRGRSMAECLAQLEARLVELRGVFGGDAAEPAAADGPDLGFRPLPSRRVVGRTDHDS